MKNAATTYGIEMTIELFKIVAFVELCLFEYWQNCTGDYQKWHTCMLID